GSDAHLVYDEVTELARRLVADGRSDRRRPARGPRWELIDPGHVAAPHPSGALLLVYGGSVAFFAALVLCGLAVGACDPRVYDLHDVERLGVETLGAVR